MFVGAQNFSYGNITSITGYDTYNAHADLKLDTTTANVKNPVIVVNSNDGMMHAIDAKNGNEVFSYVCAGLSVRMSLGRLDALAGANSSPMRNLLNENMSHRYLLDGNLVVGDAYIDKGSRSLEDPCRRAAAGGKGICAWT